MLTREQLFLSTKRILTGPCGVREPIEPESHLYDDLGLDSMGLLALAVSLENEHKMHLDENTESPPQTVNEILDLLEMRLATRANKEEVK